MDYITDAHQAELNAERLMREWGFSDAVATTGGADGGIDVRAKGALAQVKWKGGVTGRPDLQRLYGARGSGTEQLIFFSAAGYSAQAVEYANQIGMALYTYDPTGTATLVSARGASATATDAHPVISWRMAGVICVITLAVTGAIALLILTAAHFK